MLAGTWHNLARRRWLWRRGLLTCGRRGYYHTNGNAQDGAGAENFKKAFMHECTPVRPITFACYTIPRSRICQDLSCAWSAQRLAISR